MSEIDPLRGMPRTFPINTWYVACTPDEIAEKPLGRRICGQHMVIFRGADNHVAVLEDFCPHRGAPLSLGFVKDGNLTCGYHGLALDCQGHAAHMPGQRIDAFPAARAFPAIERYGFIWVWPGEAAIADPALIHPLDWAESPDWAYGGGLFHIQCDYRLMIDNLMDLTHETYVHAGSIGQKEIDEAPVETAVIDGQVVTQRFMWDIDAPPFWRAALRGAGLADDVKVDRWQICRFTAPSHVLIDVGVAHQGHGGRDAPAQYRANSIVVDFITPETDTSHWYFWGMARNFAPQDQALTDRIRAGQGAIFTEDMDMLELQQRNHLNFPQRRLMKLNIDGGGIRARQILDKMMANESSQ